jgi:hypothetical protein
MSRDERRRSVSVWFCNSPRCSCCSVCNAASLALRSCNQVVQPLHIVEAEVDPRKDEGLVRTVGHLDGTHTQHHSRCYGLQTDFASEHVNWGSDSCGHQKKKWNLTSTDLRVVLVLVQHQHSGVGGSRVAAGTSTWVSTKSFNRSIDRSLRSLRSTRRSLEIVIDLLHHADGTDVTIPSASEKGQGIWHSSCGDARGTGCSRCCSRGERRRPRRRAATCNNNSFVQHEKEEQGYIRWNSAVRCTTRVQSDTTDGLRHWCQQP